MAKAGRKPLGLAHVERKVEASDLAKLRLKMILATLSGELTIPEACARLEINESRFHKLRDDWLQAAAARLEPVRPGRRPAPVSPDAARVAELQAQVRELEVQLQAASVRAELAHVLPHVVGRVPAAEKKTSDPKTFRKERQRLLRRRGGGKSGTGTS
jgi:multidrug efflux pump subunit AcrA (membrane-fusion protein)